MKSLILTGGSLKRKKKDLLACGLRIFVNCVSCLMYWTLAMLILQSSLTLSLKHHQLLTLLVTIMMRPVLLLVSLILYCLIWKSRTCLTKMNLVSIRHTCNTYIQEYIREGECPTVGHSPSLIYS